MSRVLDKVELNPKDSKLKNEDEISIEIQNIESLDANEAQSTKDDSVGANSKNLKKDNEKVDLDKEGKSKGKVNKDFTVYNMNMIAPPRNQFPGKRSFLVYFGKYMTTRKLECMFNQVYDFEGKRNRGLRDYLLLALFNPQKSSAKRLIIN